MKRHCKIPTLLMIALFTAACEKVVDFPIPGGESKLVVNGLITQFQDEYNYVVLSRSWNYTYDYIDDDSVDYISNALVVVSDNEGRADTLYEGNPGVYRYNYNVLQRRIGNYYSVYIRLEDSTEYASEPELLDTAVLIDRIYYARNNSDSNYLFNDEYYLKVYIDMQDPPGIENYYLRLYSNFYQNKVFFANIPVVTLNDKNFDGRYLEAVEIFEGYVRRYYNFQFQQFNLSYNSYRYWTALLNQKYNGGIFSFPSSPIYGNVRNIADTNDYALGYFQVSSVARAQIYIDR